MRRSCKLMIEIMFIGLMILFMGLPTVTLANEGVNQSAAVYREVIAQFDEELASRQKQIAELEAEKSELLEAIAPTQQAFQEHTDFVGTLEDQAAENRKAINEQARAIQVKYNLDYYVNELFSARSYSEILETLTSSEEEIAVDEALIEEKNTIEKLLEEAEVTTNEYEELIAENQLAVEEVDAQKRPLEAELANLQQRASIARDHWYWPVAEVRISSPFGNRRNPFGGGVEFHRGIDLTGGSGTPIMAAKQGEVIYTGYNAAAGNHVIIQHGDQSYSYYLHLASISTTVASRVNTGDVIGGMGTTGSSTGVHLHFGISTAFRDGYVDPLPLIAE